MKIGLFCSMHWGDETSIKSTVYLSIFGDIFARAYSSTVSISSTYRNSDMRFGGGFFSPNLFKHLRMTLSVKCLFKTRLLPFYN